MNAYDRMNASFSALNDQPPVLPSRPPGKPEKSAAQKTQNRTAMWLQRLGGGRCHAGSARRSGSSHSVATTVSTLSSSSAETFASGDDDQRTADSAVAQERQPQDDDEETRPHPSHVRAPSSALLPAALRRDENIHRHDDHNPDSIRDTSRTLVVHESRTGKRTDRRCRSGNGTATDTVGSRQRRHPSSSPESAVPTGRSRSADHKPTDVGSPPSIARSVDTDPHPHDDFNGISIKDLSIRTRRTVLRNRRRKRRSQKQLDRRVVFLEELNTYHEDPRTRCYGAYDRAHRLLKRDRDLSWYTDADYALIRCDYRQTLRWINRETCRFDRVDGRRNKAESALLEEAATLHYCPVGLEAIWECIERKDRQSEVVRTVLDEQDWIRQTQEDEEKKRVRPRRSPFDSQDKSHRSGKSGNRNGDAAIAVSAAEAAEQLSEIYRECSQHDRWNAQDWAMQLFDELCRIDADYSDVRDDREASGPNSYDDNDTHR